MKKRILALVLIAVMAFGIAACTQKPVAPTITYWSMWAADSPQGLVINEAIKAFTASTGIQVQVEFKGSAQATELGTALSAGTVVDLFDGDLQAVLDNFGDYTLGLDELVNKAYEDLGGDTYRSTQNTALLSFAEERAGLKNFADSSKLHSIAYMPEVLVIIYNKDLFKDAGITLPPVSWAALESACKELIAADIVPFTFDNAYLPALFGYGMSRLIGATKTYDMVQDRDFTNEAVQEYAATWAEMVGNGYVSEAAAANALPAGLTDEMAAGTAAMYLGSSAQLAQLAELAPDTNWGAFAWPSMEGTGDASTAASFVSKSFAIHKDTAYPDETFQLVRWLTTGSWDQKLADQAAVIPAATDTTCPELFADVQAMLIASTSRLHWAVNMEADADIAAAITTAFQKLLAGEITAEEFAAALESL